MRTAYDLSLRQPPRKRHSADSGDALSGNSLALVGNVPHLGESIAEERKGRPHRENYDATVDPEDAENAKLSSPLHWKNLGTALQAGGRYGEARSAFREARRLAPQDDNIVLSLANLEMACGRYQRAYDMFRIVLDRSPQHEIGRAHV